MVLFKREAPIIVYVGRYIYIITCVNTMIIVNTEGR